MSGRLSAPPGCSQLLSLLPLACHTTSHPLTFTSPHISPPDSSQHLQNTSDSHHHHLVTQTHPSFQALSRVFLSAAWSPANGPVFPRGNGRWMGGGCSVGEVHRCATSSSHGNCGPGSRGAGTCIPLTPWPLVFDLATVATPTCCDELLPACVTVTVLQQQHLVCKPVQYASKIKLIYQKSNNEKPTTAKTPITTKP